MIAPRAARDLRLLAPAPRAAPRLLWVRPGLARPLAPLPWSSPVAGPPGAALSLRGGIAGAQPAAASGSQSPLRLVGCPGQQRRLFSTGKRLCDGKKERGEEGEEEAKRLPSDDPSQLPQHFFATQPLSTAMRSRGFLESVNLMFSLPVLKRLSKGQFVEEEFLEGAKAAVDVIMSTYCKNTMDGLEELMTERVATGFRETLEEYQKFGLTPDYECRPATEAQIMQIRFFQEEDGLDGCDIDVQVAGEQRFTLRDSTGKVVGQEGEWVNKPMVWRLRSSLPDLSWKVVDLP